jgi:ferredoxin
MPIEEKPYMKIGTAAVDRHRCIAWEQNKECLVCDEVCPFNAIEPRRAETMDGPFNVPVVREDLCTGCGICEKQCPVSGRAAIEVFRFGENRRASGPYASAYQKQKIDTLRKKSDQETISGPEK